MAFLGSATGSLGTEVDQHGPHLFSLAFDNVSRDVIKQRHRGSHRIFEMPLEFPHFSFYRLLD